MEPRSRLLGTSQFAGNFRLDFHAKGERVAVKLYQADSKQGVFYLEGFHAESPLTYENLPELARSKINNFLALHHVRIRPERVSINLPLGTPAISVMPSSAQMPEKSTEGRQLDTSLQEMSPIPYINSVKGPFIGSFPQFISSRFVLAFAHNNYGGLVRLYDLEKNELVCEMPRWQISLQEPPLYKNPFNGNTEIITGWNFQTREFITVPQDQRPLAHGYTKTFTSDGKLTITTPNGVHHELDNAVSCHLEVEDAIDPEDNGPYSEKLVCDDIVVMGEQKIAILKKNGELHVWDLNSNSCIHSFSKNEVLEYGLASQVIEDDDLTCQCYFRRDNLLGKKFNYIRGTNRSNVELFKFKFNPFTINRHQFDEEEVFKEILDDKVFTICQQNLYFRKLCGEEPRALFMELGFNVKQTYSYKNFLLFVAENNDIFLIDLINGTKRQVIPSSGAINFGKITGIKFIDNCLFLMEENFEFKTFGFKLHSFDFSPPTTSNSPVLHSASSSETNLPSHYKEQDLESKLTYFLIRRVCTVGWNPAATLVFIRDLKEKYPKEVVSQELTRIICDPDHLNHRFSSTIDRPLIPCFATYILKELDALPSQNIQTLLTKGLEALEDAYQLRCRADDVALKSHFSDIRREAMAAFCDMVKLSPENELSPLIAFLISTYENIDQGIGLKNNLLSTGEVWGMKRVIISLLTEAAKRAFPEDLDTISDVFINTLESDDRNETSILQTIETFAQVAPQKIPYLLIALSKAIENENQNPHKINLFFMGSENVFKSIVKGISLEQKASIIKVLRSVARDQQNINSRYAVMAQELLENPT